MKKFNNILEEDYFITKYLFECGAVTIRDVDGVLGKKEEPFIYSSGNRGPGYIMVKGLCGKPKLMKQLVKTLARKVDRIAGKKFDFVNGNATGGIVCGWLATEYLSAIQDRDLPFVYYRGSGRSGGHKESIVGKSYTKENSNCLIVEELVNYGKTTLQSANEFRRYGYTVDYAICILSYGHKMVHKRLEYNGITLIPLITLPRILEIAEKYKFVDERLISSYKMYFKDGLKWQLDRQMVIPEALAEVAIKRGYNMKKLDEREAVFWGAPKSRVDQGIVYYKELPRTRL